MRLPLALLCALLPSAAFAADAKPAVDLVATFVTGADEGATVGFANGQASGVMKHTGPGAFEAAVTDGPVIGFAITQKSDCIFDINFSVAGTVQGGIEIDAHKLKSVNYIPVAQHPTWSDYTITLEGAAADQIVQNIAADGTLTPTKPSSVISTSLKDTDMQAAVTEFQKNYCPAAV